MDSKTPGTTHLTDAQRIDWLRLKTVIRHGSPSSTTRRLCSVCAACAMR